MRSGKVKEYMPAGVAISVILVCIALIAVIVFMDVGDDEPNTPTREALSCSQWKEGGSVPIPILNLENRKHATLSQGTFILELDSEWSPWISLPPGYWRGVSEYANNPQVRTADRTVTDRQGYEDLSEADSVQLRGKGCLLITTNREIFERWSNIPPKQ